MNEGVRLHEMMSDTDFERDTLDINGDFLLAYGEAVSMDTFPSTAKISDPTPFKTNLHEVDFNPDIRFGVQRVTRTNRLRTGLGTIRYAKGKPLDEEAGAYQSSVLFGCRKLIDAHDEAAPEEKLYLTLDCVRGRALTRPAPHE